MRLKQQMIWTVPLVIVLATSFWATAAERRSNPFVSHMFTADPSAHVWEDGRLYVYPSSDTSPPTSYSSMDGYHVFSTDDLISWVDHGEILHSRDVEWGTPQGGNMWAPDCAYKNGRYYFYFPHRNKAMEWEIGVATSEQPASGFEVQGRVGGATGFCDPCVFIDDDGQAYLYAVIDAKCYAAKLKDNMMELDGEMVHQIGVDEHREGPFVFKRDGIYYMIYPDHHPKFNRMQYSMSDSPLGPWEPKGVFVDHTDVITMHGSVVEFKGQWYLFYHNGALSGGLAHNRSICFDPVRFNEDGSLQRVRQSIGVALPTFHADIKFNRMLGALDVGAYTSADLEQHGIRENAIASLELAPGYVVEAFEADHFQGQSWRFENSVIDLGTLVGDNRISSIKVSRKTDDNLVKNGSFEEGVEASIRYWAAVKRRTPTHGLHRILEDPADQYYALRYEGEQAAMAIQQTVAVKPQQSYTFSAKLKIDPGATGQVFVSAGEKNFTLDAGTQAGEWVSFTDSLSAGKKKTLPIRCGTSANFKGRCYWDGIELSEYEPHLEPTDAPQTITSF